MRTGKHYAIFSGLGIRDTVEVSVIRPIKGWDEILICDFPHGISLIERNYTKRGLKDGVIIMGMLTVARYGPGTTKNQSGLISTRIKLIMIMIVIMIGMG